MPVWAKRRPPCPDCGGIKQRTFSGGWANNGDLPYLYVRCEDCDYHGMQVTIWLPPEASTTGIDGVRRAAMRQNARIRRGQLPQLRPLIQRKGRRLSDDRIEIIARIIPGRLEAGLAKRIGAMRRKGSRRVAA